MISLDIAALVVVAGRALRLGTRATLDALDVAAAEAALAEAVSAVVRDAEDCDAKGPPGGEAAAYAAGLLHALIRHHPFRHGNDAVAVAAMLQFLAVNGWQADLDPPEAARAVVADLAAGNLSAADLAAWLLPRLCLDVEAGRFERRTQEARMRGWLPGRKRPARTRGMLGQRFTSRARHVVVAASEEARGLGHNYVGTEHLLLGLLSEGEGLAADTLTSLGIGLSAARQQVTEIIGPGQRAMPGHIPFTPRAKKVLELSLREAMRLNHLYVGTEHILLGLLREGNGVAVDVLAKLGAGSEQIRHTLLDVLASRATAPRDPVLPPGLKAYDEKIALVRQQKDAAIDARDFDQAADLRDSEKRLLAERAQRIAEWSAGVDVAALGEELDRLRCEVDRLQDLLLQHGIEPGEGNQQTA